MTAGEGMEPRVAEFLRSYSTYVDAFLERRSVLSASLFPEKSAQMAFGYDWVASALPGVVESLAVLPPEEVAERFRAPGSRCTALTVSGTLWMYLFGLLGRALQGEDFDVGEARRVLSFWERLYAGYTRDCQPAGRPPAKGSMYQAYRIYDEARIDRLGEGLRHASGRSVQSAIAKLTNYAWLLECESRQITFGHGLYPLADGQDMLVREFVDLRGRRYPWMSALGGNLPDEPVTIGLRLKEIVAEIDAFGVPSLSPEDYGERLTGLVVHCGTQEIAEPNDYLARLGDEAAAVQRKLFRAVMGWQPRDRFLHGATTYARILADVLTAAGRDEATVHRLTFEHLDRFSEQRLAAHVDRADPAPIWSWVGRGDRPTVFDPVLRICA